MSEEARLREEICLLSASLYQRGLTPGASGNVSARLSDGRLLVTPTGRSLGRLDPASLALFDADGTFLSGLKPTKEMPLHIAFYETRSRTGAVVHLHSTHSVAVSMLPGIDEDDVMPPLTPYGLMRCGKVKLLPIFLPGDPAMGEAVRGLAGKRAAVLLANHGPVVAGRDLEGAVTAIEELEESAKLTLLTRQMNPILLSEAHVSACLDRFDHDWQS